MKCKKCGIENDESDEFCHECGEKLPQKDNNKTIIILLAVIAILLAIIAVFASGVLTPQPQEAELESYDFGYLAMDVPAGSSFEEYSSIGKGTEHWAIGYSNENEKISELIMVWIGNYDGGNSQTGDYIGKDGDLEIYKGPYERSYTVQRHVGGYYVQLSGLDLDGWDVLKDMANSIDVEKPMTEEI